MADSAHATPSPLKWRPPSASLVLHDGIWQPPSIAPVSYPEQANDQCYQVEDQSYWFRHRMSCLQALLQHFPPAGMFWDIGGGNGYVALNLQAQGLATSMLEPGSGVFNAHRRGVQNIVRSTLEDAGFVPRTMPAVGAFDVIEHIADEKGFLGRIHDALVPGGRFYCTVPSLPFLWSAEDEHAGHFRRYSLKTLRQALEKARFELEFATYFFTWLILPIWLFRVAPYRLGLVRPETLGTSQAMQADHRLPGALDRVMLQIHDWERRRIARQQPLPFGSSLLCVARAI